MSVERGPLVYSLKIDEKRVEIQRDSDFIRRVLKQNNIQGFPAVEFYPQSEWRYGMEVAQKNAPKKFKVIKSPMPENPFLADTAPIRIEVPLHALPQWEAAWQPVLEPPPADLKLSPKNPISLPGETELQSTGAGKIMTLVPYGGTHLRLTTLPLIKA